MLTIALMFVSVVTCEPVDWGRMKGRTYPSMDALMRDWELENGVPQTVPDPPVRFVVPRP
jgi:hypothetical protein